MEKIPWTGGTDEEYETQNFDIGSQRFKIALREMIEYNIKLGVKDLESYLVKSLQLNETDEKVVNSMCQKLVHIYFERSKPCFKTIEAEIDAMLKIPSNVLLPEDEIQLKQTDNEAYEKLKEEIANLKKRLERCAIIDALIKKEDEEIKCTEKIYLQTRKYMDVLDSTLQDIETSDSLKSIANFKQNFDFSNIPFMKTQSKEDLFRDYDT